MTDKLFPDWFSPLVVFPAAVSFWRLFTAVGFLFAPMTLDQIFERVEIDSTSYTGLRWLPQPREKFKSSRGYNVFKLRISGRSAGTKNTQGYWEVKIDGLIFLVHRLIYSRINGAIPEGYEVDHRDLNRKNNNPSNLRLATRSNNMCNRHKYANVKGKTLSSIFKGVSRNGTNWRARISVGRVTKYLGNFATPEEAHKAYCQAARELHGDFARTA